MTFKELHKILDDENKKIALKEYQEILYQLKWDVNDEIYKLTKEDITHPKLKWYYGEMNAFQLALDLSEHLEEEEEKVLKKALEIACKNAIPLPNGLEEQSINKIVQERIETYLYLAKNELKTEKGNV